MVDIQDEIIRVYSRLSALKSNLEKFTSPIEEMYVKEFHTILDKFETLWGKNLSEFRVSDSYVNPQVRTVHGDGSRTYSHEKYVDRAFFLAKLDAILTYFEISKSKEPPHIGFRT